MPLPDRCPGPWGFSGHPIGRRSFLKTAGAGCGLLGLAALLQNEGLADASGDESKSRPDLAKAPHFPAKAKSVIWLFMSGGPSAVDLFDPKPELQKNHGKRLEGKGEIDVFFGKPGPLMRSPFKFKQYGKSGAWVSELLPHLSRHVDDIAFVKSMQCETNNHSPALLQMNSGMIRIGFPSVGSWVTYGLGSANRNLPGFIVMYDHRGGPIGGSQNWGSGFLPSTFQGMPFRTSGPPILNLAAASASNPRKQRIQAELLRALNAEHIVQHPDERELEGRIQSYEMAYRMQMEVPQTIDLEGESAQTKELYGMDNNRTKYFGTQLLMARRLVERGVRFIQIYSGGGHDEVSNWDAHVNLKENHEHLCRETDQPVAGLLTDLKQRGLLDSTLVIWGGEFGRMPISQASLGRDHNPHGFLVWLAGAGVKPGVSYGETDEVGYKAATNMVTVNDLHATILHLLGIDHKRLTFAHNGRKFRLTDVAGNVVQPILA